MIVCRECGSGRDVLCWPTDRPEDAVCPGCCPDHIYEYIRGEQTWFCDTCGQEPPQEWLDERGDER